MAVMPQSQPDSEPEPRRPADFAGRIFTGSDESTPPSELDGVLDEFTARWERGDRPRAEDYLGRLAPDAPGDVVELVYHEYCLAESSGLAPDPSSFLVRFPEHRDRLGRLFGLHEAWDDSVLRDWALPVSLPEVGDEVGPYRLLRVLGRGGFACVFLAEEANLDHRLVVLKVSTRASAEPRLLARARHSHIVEVLRHDRAEDGALHLVAMPFLGGATLARVLAERRRRGGRTASGRDLLRDLDEVGDPAFPAPGLARSAREILGGLSHAKAVAWIVARLAEALDHAHRHGVAHGDLKPANILLTADGHPMLFDFNLAVDWSRAEPEGQSGEAGGTLAYMAPERLLALAEPGATSRPRAIERHKADLFALGLILRESLGGPPPALAQGPGRPIREQVVALRTARMREPAAAWVPASLRPILARCLAPDPADRYGRAAELAEDLDRWRADLPPAFADAPSWRFAPVRWARRRRVLLAAGSLALAVGGLAAVVVGRAYEGPLRASALVRRDAAWAVVEPRVFRYRDGWQIKAEGDPVDSAKHHLDAYGILGPGDWRLRDDVRYLAEGDREELEAWLMEQAWRYAAALEARHASGDDRRRALACLERASALAHSSILEAECRALRARLGLPEPPPSPSPGASIAAPGWVEEYLLGVEAEPQHAAVAFEHYLNVLRTRPESFWAHYRAAGVACRLGDFHGGADHLIHCVRRFPANPALRTQLAACLNALGKTEAALEECERALALSPDFREAIRTRALIRARLGQAEGVRADLARYEALSRRREPGSTWNLCLELRDGPSPPDRELPLRAALAADPDDTWVRYELAKDLHDRGRQAESLAECDAILATDPNNLRAQFSRANVLAKSEKKDEACRAYQALIAHPRFDELLREYTGAISAFHNLSRLLLESGDVSGGLAVAREGLAQAERFNVLQGESHFRLACAYALAARSDPGSVEQAAHQLKRASGFQRDYRDRWFPREPMFDPVRPNLVRLLALP